MSPNDFHAARKALGLTQTGMAETLGINRRTVQRAESGQWPVSPRTARQVQQLLQTLESAQ